MSQVSIFEKKWLEIVFENKNKEYGAYQLRTENPRTTLKAFVFGLVFLLGSVFVLSSFSAKTTPITVADDETVIRIDRILPPKFDEPKTEAPKSNPIKTPEKQPDNALPVVVVTAQAQPDIPKNIDLKNTTSNEGQSGNNSGGGLTPLDGNGSDENTNKNPDNSNEIFSKSVLEVNPSFPGGINKFYEYVAKNFNAPNSDEDAELIKVTVSFVIEKDGSLSNIKIVNSAGNDADKEALRVLKSLKTKWFPGKMGDNAVRTQYLLPITINPNP